MLGRGRSGGTGSCGDRYCGSDIVGGRCGGSDRG